MMEHITQTSRKATALLAIVTVIAVAAIWGVSRASSPAATDHARTSISIDGMQLPFDVKQYAKLADLVVIGTPVTESLHAFTENTQIPESAKSDEMYATAGYYDVTVQVGEYVKGKGPVQISIRRLAPPPDVVLDSEAPQPQLNQPYVFFLETGTELWAGGYLALGQQSVGVLAADVVEFPDKKMSVEKFREEVKSAEEDKNKDKG